ncbi:MAG: VWA domain-containing protein [Microcoleus sp.]
MINNIVTLTEFLQHIQTENQPFIIKNNGQPPLWRDAELHQSFYAQNPEQYALLAPIDKVTTFQRVRMLFMLLQQSRAGMSKPIRQTLERVTNVLLAIVPPDLAIGVFLALRRVRANHKHTTRAILNYILNHPQFEDLALRRRPAIADILEHALGKNTARGAIKQLAHAAPNTAELQSKLLRNTRQSDRVKTVLPYLYHPPLGSGLMPPVGPVKYTSVSECYTVKLEKQQQSPTTITATNRGEISATIVHLYRGGDSQELRNSLEQSVQAETAKLPYFAGKVALVFDASASTRSYGEREFCALSQSVALKLIIEKCCPNLQVHLLGGAGELPIPEGATDLATAVIDALLGEPDLVIIVSDGYENVYPGDLARVAATLPRLKVETPVVFCHSKFTDRDDLSLRRAAPNLPQLEFWHQDDFSQLLLDLFSRVKSSLAEQCFKEFLLRKLDCLERELVLWTANN